MKNIGFIAFILWAGLSVTGVFAQATRGVGVKVKGAGGQEKEIKLYQGSYALVIGESNYVNGWSNLSSVPGDVQAVSRILQRHGFWVEMSENLSSRDLDARIKQFIDDYGFQPNNRLLIYYAGHGHTLKSAGDGREVGYIVPVDTPFAAADETGFRRRAISMDTIQNYAKEIQSKHALFIFDSCFSGKLVSRGEFTVPPIIQENVAYPVRQFITAGAANQLVPDESIFRRAFVRGLEGEADRSGDGYITGTELAGYLMESVTNYSERRQTPQYGKINDIELDRGDFVFVVPQANLSDPPLKTPKRAAGKSETDSSPQGAQMVDEQAASELSEDDLKTRVGFFFTGLQSDSTARGVIFNYGTDREVASREAEIRKIINARRYDLRRITFKRGGTKPGIMTRFFIVPAGAEEPKP